MDLGRAMDVSLVRILRETFIVDSCESKERRREGVESSELDSTMEM